MHTRAKDTLLLVGGAVLCCLNDGRLTIREGTATLGSLCLYRPDEI